MRLRTPPEASPTVSAPFAVPAPLRRELLADVSCARTLIERFGGEPDSFSVISFDLVKHLESGSSTMLAGATAVVMGPVLPNGRSALEVIEQLRGAYPHIGIYLVAKELVEIARALPKLAAAGVDEVFAFESPSDMRAFVETVSARLAAPAPETEIRLLWKWFRESNERSLVMHCVRNGFRLDVWTIRSQVFNACRKTLQNRMTLVGLPSPGIVSRYGRVLHAQELERRGVRPTAAVADILGFPSAGAMQRARRRLRKALMSRGRQALVFASLLK